MTEFGCFQALAKVCIATVTVDLPTPGGPKLLDNESRIPAMTELRGVTLFIPACSILISIAVILQESKGMLFEGMVLLLDQNHDLCVALKTSDIGIRSCIRFLEQPN